MVMCIVFGLAAAPSQGPEVRNIMREKLDHTQQALEAVVTSDWAALQNEAQALERLTNDPRWIVLKFPEYSRQSTAFVRALQALRSAAASRDLDKTPEAFTAVTLQCIACHRYVARMRVAR
jgi:hypothetical protein